MNIDLRCTLTLSCLVPTLLFARRLSNCMVITVLGFFAMTDGIHVFAALWLFIQFGACTLLPLLYQHYIVPPLRCDGVTITFVICR